MRNPHTVTPVLGKGTPSVPLDEAVGAYQAPSEDRLPVPPPQDEGPPPRELSEGRSRSRDPPREVAAAAVPIAQPQATMNMTVPEYMLPIMAMAGIGHLSPNQPVIPSVSGALAGLSV